MPKITVAVIAIMLAAAWPAAALAKTLKIGSDPAVATITLPDAWDGSAEEGQVEALSSDKAIYLSVETVSAEDLKTAGQDVARQLADQKIELDQKSRKVAPVTIAGMSGAAISWEAKDADGPTQVHMVTLKARPDTEILVLRWGDEGAEKNHAAEVDAILKSLAPIK